MEHATIESTKIYADTKQSNDFLIFHDGSSQWWESETQQYLVSRNFGHRQLRCKGDTSKEFKRYHHKAVGDSPELCRALDALGHKKIIRMFRVGIHFCTFNRSMLHEISYTTPPYSLLS